MQLFMRYVLGSIVYSAGVYASYVDINSKVVPHTINIVSEKKTLGSTIILFTKISYQYSKEYYSIRVNPIVYSVAWPVIQYTMLSTSIFIGTLCGTLEWRNKNN